MAPGLFELERLERPAQDGVLLATERMSGDRGQQRADEPGAAHEQLARRLRRSREASERVHRMWTTGPELEAGHPERLGEALVLTLRVDDEGLASDPAATEKPDVACQQAL